MTNYTASEASHVPSESRFPRSAETSAYTTSEANHEAIEPHFPQSAEASSDARMAQPHFPISISSTSPDIKLGSRGSPSSTKSKRDHIRGFASRVEYSRAPRGHRGLVPRSKPLDVMQVVSESNDEDSVVVDDDDGTISNNSGPSINIHSEQDSCCFSFLQKVFDGLIDGLMQDDENDVSSDSDDDDDFASKIHTDTLLSASSSLIDLSQKHRQWFEPGGRFGPTRVRRKRTGSEKQRKQIAP